MWDMQGKWRGRNGEAASLAVDPEDLLHQVWLCERWSRLEDRLDLAARATNRQRG